MLAEREIATSLYMDWSDRYRRAKLLSEGKEQEIERLQDEMET